MDGLLDMDTRPLYQDMFVATPRHLASHGHRTVIRTTVDRFHDGNFSVADVSGVTTATKMSGHAICGRFTDGRRLFTRVLRHL